MARHVVTESDRIDFLVRRAYGAVLDVGLETIIRASPWWDGSARPRPGSILEIPAALGEFEYTPTVDPQILDIRRRLDG